MDYLSLLASLSASVNVILIGLGLFIYYRNKAKNETIKLKDTIINRKDIEISELERKIVEVSRDTDLARAFLTLAREQGELMVDAKIVRSEIESKLNNLKDETRSDWEKLRYIDMIAKFGTQARFALKPLLELVESKNPQIAWYSLKAITDIERQKTSNDEINYITKAIICGLKHPNSSIRSYSAFLAKRYKVVGSKEVLHKLCYKDDAYSVRVNCCDALKGIGEKAPDVDHQGYPMFAYIMVKARLAEQITFKGFKELAEENKELAVIEAAVVQGPYDLIVKVSASDKEEFDQTVMSFIQNIQGVEYTRTYQIVGPPPYLYWVKESAINKAELPISWILLEVPSPQSGGVVLCTQDHPYVVEAATVFGEKDVILKLQAPNEQKISDCISQIRKLASVKDSLTLSAESSELYLPLQRFPWHSDVLI